MSIGKWFAAGSVLAVWGLVPSMAAPASQPAGAVTRFDYSALPTQPAAVAKMVTVEGDAERVVRCKVSLSQATAAAEKHVGGKATEARIEPDGDELRITVDVWKDGHRQRVNVDPVTGKVVEVKPIWSPYFPGGKVSGEPQKTESGVMYYDIRVGEGEEASDPAKPVLIHYSAWLLDGKLWQSSHQREDPIAIPLGRLPKGWAEGIKGMRAGGYRKLIIPSELALGKTSAPGLPANAAMIVDIECAGIPVNKPVSPEEIAAARKIGESVQGEPVKTPSGLHYFDIHEGDGEKPPTPTTQVKVQYTGWLTNGKKFDSSYDKGQPATFGLSQVVKGWGEGVGSMKVGGRRKLIIPAELAYGLQGSPPNVPPAATLVFDVELVEILGEMPTATAPAAGARPSRPAKPAPEQHPGSAE